VAPIREADVLVSTVTDRVVAAWVGLGFLTVVLSACGAVLLAWPTSIAALLTTDPALIFTTASLIALSDYALIADGGKVVMANALRAAGETRAPTAMHVVSYVSVMLLACRVLAFPMELVAPVLFGGIVVAASFQFHSCLAGSGLYPGATLVRLP